MYLFPHSTCETHNTHKNNPIQPWSFYINLINAILLFIFVLVSSNYKNKFVTLALFSFLLFELWHSFSHYKHLENDSQTHISIVHILGYFMTFSLYLAISQLSSNYNIPTEWMIILIFSIILDTYIFFFIHGYWTIFGGLFVISIMMGANFHKIPRVLYIYLLYLALGVIILFLLFVNEAHNCEKMKDKIGDLPFHAFVEVLGLLLFVGLSTFLMKWNMLIYKKHSFP